MLKKRIIPCLDIKNGRVVKGINFEEIKDAGHPIELAKRYVQDGADELVFLDITATLENRKTLVELVSEIASEINIPFTVGGGINDIEDAKVLLNSGADKLTINSSAIQNPKLITKIANEFGSQCVVLAIDTKFIGNKWIVFRNGGKIKTELNALDWAEKGISYGAGEILLTSMSNDGTQSGFALNIINEISEKIPVPVIASGGAGKVQDFADVFQNTKATGALAASVFHYGQINILKLKQFLNNKNISVRL